MGAKTFFSKSEQQQIVDAIAVAEKNTSGEIRIHLDDTCKGNVLDAAALRFNQLKMHKTELRNGVLFYLSVNDHQFAIIGDKGISEKVPEDFWNNLRDTVILHFKQQQFSIGLVKGIEMAGEKLKEYFPYQSNDKNELSNEISFR